MAEEKFNKYSYSYRVGLTPVSSELINFEEDKLSDKDRQSSSVKEYISTKIEEFSCKCLESVYNTKEVDMNSIMISERTITFTLYSIEELPILGKSIRLFSKLVLEEPYFQRLLVKGKLFKTFIPVETKKNDNKIEVIDVSTVSDTELVKGLVEILAIPEYSIKPEIRSAIQQMKVLAIKSSLIKV